MEALKLVAMDPWEEGDWSRGERSGQEEGVSSEGRSSLAPQRWHLLAVGSARGSRSWPAFIETTSCGSELRLWGNTEAFLGIKIH